MADPVDPWHGLDTPASVPPTAHQPPAHQPPAPQPPVPQPPAHQSHGPQPSAPVTVPQPPAPAPATGYAVYPTGQPGGAFAYSHDPMTGQPLSEKSKVVAGLLQLLPGVALGLAGIGRLYAGHTALGVIQIVATVFGWVSFWCGFLLLFPFLIYAGVWLWAVIDGITLLAGRPVDGQGRLLRS